MAGSSSSLSLHWLQRVTLNPHFTWNRIVVGSVCRLRSFCRTQGGLAVSGWVEAGDLGTHRNIFLGTGQLKGEASQSYSCAPPNFGGLRRPWHALLNFRAHPATSQAWTCEKKLGGSPIQESSPPHSLSVSLRVSVSVCVCEHLCLRLRVCLCRRKVPQNPRTPSPPSHAPRTTCR